MRDKSIEEVLDSEFKCAGKFTFYNYKIPTQSAPDCLEIFGTKVTIKMTTMGELKCKQVS